MKSVLRFWWIGIGALALASVQPQPLYAQETAPEQKVEQERTPAVEAETPAVEAQTPAVEANDRPARDGSGDEWQRAGRQRDRDHDHWDGSWEDNENVVINFFGDSTLAVGETADAVVSIVGSSTSAGIVKDAVVSVLGSSRVTGSVGQDVVSVLGDTYVDSDVAKDAVAVFGNLELGPKARIGGEAVAVFGTVKRHPDAVVTRGVKNVGFAGDWDGLRAWVRHCLMLGRPLALESGLEWAWALALGFLGFYVLLGLMFAGAMERCVQTFEEKPGQTILTSLIAVLASPVLMVLLMITVVGLAFVPFVGLALFVLGLFGKAVVLAALGRRVTRYAGASPLNHVAVAVLVGGVFILALYLVPVLGFITYKVLGILGLGVVLYTLILTQRARREAALAAAPVALTAAVASPGYTTVPTYDSVQATGEPIPATGPAMTSTAAAAPLPDVAPTALPRADFWIRMGALFIDFVLVGIVLNIIVTFDVDNLMLVGLATYGAVMWKLRGTTIGGIICNLRVIRQDGRELDWGTAIIRALSCFLSFVAAGLGFFWILFDKERQGWHDKIAGTIVVRDIKARSLV